MKTQDEDARYCVFTGQESRPVTRHLSLRPFVVLTCAIRRVTVRSALSGAKCTVYRLPLAVPLLIIK